MGPKVYLGDSVYAQAVDGMLKLTTENGLGPSNVIFLEPEVLSALYDYLKEHGSAATRLL